MAGEMGMNRDKINNLGNIFFLVFCVRKFGGHPGPGPGQSAPDNPNRRTGSGNYCCCNRDTSPHQLDMISEMAMNYGQWCFIDSNEK